MFRLETGESVQTQLVVGQVHEIYMGKEGHLSGSYSFLNSTRWRVLDLQWALHKQLVAGPMQLFHYEARNGKWVGRQVKKKEKKETLPTASYE